MPSGTIGGSAVAFTDLQRIAASGYEPWSVSTRVARFQHALATSTQRRSKPVAPRNNECAQVAIEVAPRLRHAEGAPDTVRSNETEVASCRIQIRVENSMHSDLSIQARLHRSLKAYSRHLLIDWKVWSDREYT